MLKEIPGWQTPYSKVKTLFIVTHWGTPEANQSMILFKSSKLINGSWNLLINNYNYQLVLLLKWTELNRQIQNSTLDDWLDYLCLIAARCDWRIFWSRWSSGSNLRRFWWMVVTSTRTVASLLLISNPRSLGSIVNTSTAQRRKVSCDF